MFDTIRKSRQIGNLVVDRAGDYLELMRIELEIQRHELLKRAAAFAIMGLAVLLSAIFVGFAVITSFWDTPYREMSAWFVAALFVVTGVIAYFAFSGSARMESAIAEVSRELQQDIKLAREMM